MTSRSFSLSSNVRLCIFFFASIKRHEIFFLCLLISFFTKRTLTLTREIFLYFPIKLATNNYNHLKKILINGGALLYWLFKQNNIGDHMIQYSEGANFTHKWGAMSNGYDSQIVPYMSVLASKTLTTILIVYKFRVSLQTSNWFPKPAIYILGHKYQPKWLQYL